MRKKDSIETKPYGKKSLSNEDKNRLYSLDIILDLVANANSLNNSKENALRVLQTYHYILVSQDIIQKKFNRDISVYKNDMDNQNGVLQDSNNTPFHLNNYQDADQAIASIKNTIDSLIAAFKKAQEMSFLAHFIDKFFYGQQAGSLEAIVSAPLLFISTYESTGLSNLDDVMHDAFQAVNSNDNFVKQINSVKKNLILFVGELFNTRDGIKALSWDLAKEQISHLLMFSDSQESLLLDQLFSEAEIFLSYLNYDNITVSDHLGLREYRSKQLSFIEKFSYYIHSLQCLRDDPALLKRRISKDAVKDEYVLTLPSRVLRLISIASNFPLNFLLEMNGNLSSDSLFSSEKERIASVALSQPYYGKTISGFASDKAWSSVITAVTLRNKEDKCPFRDPKYKEQKPFRVRLNPNTEKYEIHNINEPSQSLYKEEKDKRQRLGMLPLPPHQSFTYYEPQNTAFDVTYFSPNKLSTIQKKELIGIRLKTEGAFINRIPVHDAGSANVYYGFSTETEAETFKQLIDSEKKWACNLDELRKKQKPGYYNEVMVRANWDCDGSSQLVIYPSAKTLEGRYAAILYKHDLEQHLSTHGEIYQHAPVNWYAGYQVPISFWDKRNPYLYTEYEQQFDLNYEPKTARAILLKGFIYYVKNKTIPMMLLDQISNLASNSTNKEWLEYTKFLAFLSFSPTNYLSAIFNQINIDNLLCVKNLFTKLILCRSTEGISRVMGHLNKSPEHLKKVLSETVSINFACQMGYVPELELLINAALKFKHENKTDVTLQRLILSKSPTDGTLAFPLMLAAHHGHVSVIKVLLHAAIELKKINSDDKTLKEMLLTTNSNNSPLIILARNGHIETLKLLIDSLLYLQSCDSSDTTLKELFLKVKDEFGRSLPILSAFQNKHIESFELILNAYLIQSSSEFYEDLILNEFYGFKLPKQTMHYMIQNLQRLIHPNVNSQELQSFYQKEVNASNSGRFFSCSMFNSVPVINDIVDLVHIATNEEKPCALRALLQLAKKSESLVSQRSYQI